MTYHRHTSATSLTCGEDSPGLRVGGFVFPRASNPKPIGLRRFTSRRGNCRGFGPGPLFPPARPPRAVRCGGAFLPCSRSTQPLSGGASYPKRQEWGRGPPDAPPERGMAVGVMLAGALPLHGPDGETVKSAQEGSHTNVRAHPIRHDAGSLTQTGSATHGNAVSAVPPPMPPALRHLCRGQAKQ